MAFMRSFLLLIFSMMLFVEPMRAQPVDGGHARVELISERALAVPGERVWFGLSFEIDPNWHIYWVNPGDAGIPPEITWCEAGGLTSEAIGAFSWPLPEMLPVVPGQIMDYGYSNEIVLPFAVDLPENAEGPILFEGVADYLICEDICIPESAEIRLLQSIGSAQLPDEANAQKIQEALASVPPVFDGDTTISSRGDYWILSMAGDAVAGNGDEVRFFPYGHEITHAAEQPSDYGAAGISLQLTPANAGNELPVDLSGVVKVGDAAFEVNADSGTLLTGTTGSVGLAVSSGTNLMFLMGLALVGGLILNLMPCVLPVLSIKAIGMVSSTASGNAKAARVHGLWYAAGVLVTFGALAIAILGVRAATGVAIWGFWLQNPVLVTALVLIVFLIGLWLLGLFELGSSVQSVGSGLAAKQGSVGAFFTGVLAAVVGAPCTGPFLGAALGAVMTQPALNVVLVLLTMGLGMALPFLVLSFSPGLQRFMPKPGAWMETLKQVFAFPMFLTAAWLLSVLGALSGYRMAAMVVAGAALVAFGIWAIRSANQGAKAILLSVLGLALIVPVFGLISPNGWGDKLMSLIWMAGMIGAFILIARMNTERTSQLVKGVASLAIMLGLIWPLAQARSAQPPGTTAETYSAEYETEAWSPERVAELTAEGRSIFVDFTAEWCVTCQANKLQTLQTRPVIEAFEAGNVAFLVADFTNGDKTIALELQKHNRAGVPMYLWYPAGETTPEVLPELLSIDLVTGLVETTR